MSILTYVNVNIYLHFGGINDEQCDGKKRCNQRYHGVESL